MGQKVHPYGFRLGYTKPWKARWYMDRDFDKLLIEDIKLKEELKKITNKEVKILINEIKRPELDAYLVAENIAQQLEGRIAFRRAMKNSITAAMRMGAEGVRVMTAGRLAVTTCRPSSMARSTRRLPPSTLITETRVSAGQPSRRAAWAGVVPESSSIAWRPKKARSIPPSF